MLVTALTAVTAAAAAAAAPCSLTGQYVMGRERGGPSKDNMTITQAGGTFTVSAGAVPADTGTWGQRLHQQQSSHPLRLWSFELEADLPGPGWAFLCNVACDELCCLVNEGCRYLGS